MKKILLPGKIISLILILFFVVHIATAATITIQSNTNWSAITTGSGTGGLPNNTDAVYVRSGAILTVNSTTAICLSLQLGRTGSTTASTGTLTFAATGTPSLTVVNGVILGGTTSTGSTGTITFVSGASMSVGSLQLGSANAAGTITMTNGSTLTVNGAITIGAASGTWNPGTGTVIMTATNTLPATIFTSFYNLTINGGTTTSSGVALTINNNLSVTQGNLILSATDNNYTVTNDLTISANGTLTHSVYWDGTSKLLSIGGNIAIDGVFAYTVRSHVQMNSSGTKTVRTGSNPASAFSILTLLNGTFNANGTLKVNDNFWAMFGSVGSFHTYGQSVTALSAILVNNGTLYVDGGTLNVTGGISVGAGTNNSAVVINTGILNSDVITVGNGTNTGTFSQTGGTTNLSGNLLIYPSCSYTCTNSPVINIGGNFTNNGTYTKATETVILNGIAQNIGGSSATAFYNLSLAGSGTKTIGAARTISGDLAINTGVVADLGTFTSSANKLSFGGSGVANGTWGSTSSPATNQNNTYFAATTGMLSIATSSCASIPFATVSGQTNISCYGGSDGTITIGAIGGIAPYSYSVDNGSTWISSGTNPYPYVGLTVANGPYRIKVKDTMGCLSK